MRTYKEKKVLDQQVHTVSCDFCLKNLKVFKGMPLKCSYIQIISGYGSVYDDIVKHLDICDDCYQKKFGELSV